MRASPKPKPPPRQQLDPERLAREDEERGSGWAGDAEFFRQNPDRGFRMRLATGVKLLQHNSSLAALRLPTVFTG